MALIFSSLALTQAKLTEAECPNVDLTDKFSTVRDQANSGQCFAFVAADLISYHQGLPPEEAVSAIDVAVTYLKTSPAEFKAEATKVTDFNSYKEMAAYLIPSNKRTNYARRKLSVTQQFEDGGGVAPLAVLAYQKNSGGLCLEKNLRSEGSVVDDESYNYIHQRLRQAAGEKRLTNFGDYYSRRKDLVDTKIRTGSREICDIRKDRMDSMFGLSTKLNAETLSKVTENFDKSCKERKSIKPMKVATQSTSRGPEAFTAKAIAQSLKDKNPSGISYDSSFLTEGRKSAMLKNDHASLIIGSRWNKESATCEFKLRNSWGRDCTIYAPEFQKNCEQGNVWISDTDINDRVGAIDLVFPG